jgi:hypothetical protein
MTLEQLIKEKAFTIYGRRGQKVIAVNDLLEWMLEQPQEGRVTLAMVGKSDER